MTSNLYQNTINEYLAQVYASQPTPDKIILISSHDYEIPTTNKFCFPGPIASQNTTESTNLSAINYYFIRGLTISAGKDNLAVDHLADLYIELICGGQTWVRGQLGILDHQAIKKLLIPIPAPESGQDITMIFKSLDSNNQWHVMLTFDVVLLYHPPTAINNPGGLKDLPITRQIFYEVPTNGLIAGQNNSIYRDNLARSLDNGADIKIILPASTNICQVYLHKIPDTNNYNELEPEKIILQLADDITGLHQIWSRRIFSKNKSMGEPMGDRVCGPSGNCVYKLCIMSERGLDITSEIITRNPGSRFCVLEQQIVRYLCGMIGLAF